MKDAAEEVKRFGSFRHWRMRLRLWLHGIFPRGARIMNLQVVLLLILMALVAPWIKTLTRELFMLLRSVFRGEATKDESLLQRVSPKPGPGPTKLARRTPLKK